VKIPDEKFMYANSDFNYSGHAFVNHVLELEPSVAELAELEYQAQTSFLKLKRKKWTAVH
jgi:hypothetical protein